MKLTLLGAPGAGKGTQAEILSRKLDVPTVSTGNILRAAIKDGTEVGLAAKAYIDQGRLVPDEVIVRIVKERLSEPDCARGFILDGMPRTIPQAQALQEQSVELDAVISLEIPDELIVERMSGRRVCPRCGATYHVEGNPPREEGRCDKCGSQLSIRADDAPETVRERLAVYHDQTEPLKEFYRQLGLLRTVDEHGDIQQVSAAVLRALELSE